MMLNERILRLIVLADELHFGRAAERLHLSQPALTSSVKHLESEFGVRLFRRTTRNVELTEAGNLLAAEARRMVEETSRTIALVRNCPSDFVGPLQVGYPDAMNLHWLGALMADARKSGFPDRALQFISAEARTLREQLAEGVMQLAFFAGNPPHHHFPDFSCVKLFRESLKLVLSTAHRLAGCASIRLDQLDTEPVVWLRNDINPLLHASFAAQCASHGYHPRIIQEVRTFRECLCFAREGLGITFLPASMQPESAGEAIVFIGPSGALHLQYAMAYRKNSGMELVDRFVEFVQNRVSMKALRSQAESIKITNQSLKTND